MEEEFIIEKREVPYCRGEDLVGLRPKGGKSLEGGKVKIFHRIITDSNSKVVNQEGGEMGGGGRHQILYGTDGGAN